MLKSKIFCILIFILIFNAGSIFSEEKKTNPNLPKIIARHYEREKELIFASGDVEVHYQDIQINADRIEYNQTTDDLLAEGNVTIQMPNQVISGEKLFFNLASRQGKIINALGMIQPSIFYQAKSIDKEEEELYKFSHASFTSCTQPTPRWKFTSREGKLKREEYIEMKNSIFWIKNVPIFYIPYLRYPFKRRSTGFLIPQIGYSAYKGYFISQGFFWAIKRNLDATFNLDYYTLQGIAGGLEFRYIFSEGTTGNLNLYYLKYKQKSDRDYLFRFKHNQSLKYDFKLIADVDLQSSLHFLKEFDNNFNRATISNLKSQVYLSKSWSYLNFNLRADRLETYFSKLDKSNIVSHLPQVQLNLTRKKIFFPLYFSFDSTYDNVRRMDITGKDYSANRFDFYPTLSIPFSSIPWLSVNTSFSTRQTYYSQSYDPETKTYMDQPIHRQFYQTRLDLIGPTFYRIYYGPGNSILQKVKHIIEPKISYQYSSKIKNLNQIPRFDYSDVPRYHQLSYSLTNRIFIKKKETPVEIITFEIGQTFYFEPEEVIQLKNVKVNGKTPQFSDINSSLRINPSSKYSADIRLFYNPYYKKLSLASIIANLGAPQDNWFIRVSWNMRDDPYRKSLWNRNQMRFYSGIKIPRLSIEAHGEIDYDFFTRKTQYSALSLTYHYQCLDFKGEIKIFNFRDKPDTQFRFSIGLGNIGSATDFLGGTGF
ncbi:MAG: LPS-assembly protein LptD [Candidatus Aminicenantia bacterium]